MDAALEKLSKQELILLLNAERKAAEEKVKDTEKIDQKTEDFRKSKFTIPQDMSVLISQQQKVQNIFASSLWVYLSSMISERSGR